MGILGWKYTAKDISQEIGISEERIEELAKSGFAPCLISEDGKPFFKKQDIISWARFNLYKDQKGIEVPVNFKVFISEAMSPEKGVPVSLSSIPELKEYVPRLEPPCIYFLVKGGEVIYVGKSVDLASRIQTHMEDKDFDRVFVIHVPLHALDEAEKGFIKSLRPRLNKTHNEDNPVNHKRKVSWPP